MTNEKRRITPCADAVIRAYECDASNQSFAENQRTMAAELIRCHFEAMTPRARHRAVQTIRWLETGGRGPCDSFLLHRRRSDFWRLPDETT